MNLFSQRYACSCRNRQTWPRQVMKHGLIRARSGLTSLDYIPGGKVGFMPVFRNGRVPHQLSTRNNVSTGQLIPGRGLAWYWHSRAQSWDQVSANNRLRSNASSEPGQISVLIWYQFPLPRQCQWTTCSQVTFRSSAGGRPCLCQHYASIPPILQILLRYWCVTKPVVNLHLGTGSDSGQPDLALVGLCNLSLIWNSRSGPDQGQRKFSAWVYVKKEKILPWFGNLTR